MDNIKDVSDILTFEFILFDSEIVSLPIRLDNIKDVSAMFSFILEDTIFAIFIESILFDKETVSVPILSDTYCVLANVPEVGNITLLAAVVVIVKSPMPFVIKLLDIEIVLSLLATPVPPFDPGKILEIVPEESENLAVSEVNE